MLTAGLILATGGFAHAGVNKFLPLVFVTFGGFYVWSAQVFADAERGENASTATDFKDSKEAASEPAASDGHRGRPALGQVRATFASLMRSAPPTGRYVLGGMLAVLALSALNLLLSLVLGSQYVDWYLHQHGRDHNTARRGEVAGVWITLGIRAALSLLWIGAFGKLLDVIRDGGRRAVATCRLYALVCVVGYGYLLFAGGPWWTLPARIGQVALGGLVLVASLTPPVTRWLRSDR